MAGAIEKKKNETVEELEVFDVDHEWEFEVAEILYRKFRNDFNIS